MAVIVLWLAVSAQQKVFVYHSSRSILWMHFRFLVFDRFYENTLRTGLDLVRSDGVGNSVRRALQLLHVYSGRSATRPGFNRHCCLTVVRQLSCRFPLVLLINTMKRAYYVLIVAELLLEVAAVLLDLDLDAILAILRAPYYVVVLYFCYVDFIRRM